MPTGYPKQGIHRRTPIEITGNLRKRFFAAVDRDDCSECWKWTACFRNGYGAIKHRGKVLGAHRVSYVIHHGQVPDGHILRHTCDNKWCVNPSHLTTGTPQDNVNDAIVRGIHNTAKGELHPHSVLTEDLVRSILLRRRRTGHGARRLSRHFGIAESTIKSVIDGKTWKHVARV